MLVNRAAERDWQIAEQQGIEKSVFRVNNKGGKTAIIRMKKGAHFPHHVHEGNAEIMMLDGQVLIGGVELNKGDYLYAKSGEEHDIVALTDTEIFLSTEQAMTLIT
ncbi:cupin domain-containing protein [Methylophaga sp.]|jgi:quercetin dioxygenase-like cupin family protein|uniref:cupin domain-containing protein n=1 Tax=Methylophaga sp. TaxID=2024840 RepID=UPI0013FEE073|nr:cupin domain-containing protein [Methylophaga sp.]MTI63916.1 cupin domain-containing protein [Methylophaga sp.]